MAASRLPLCAMARVCAANSGRQQAVKSGEGGIVESGRAQGFDGEFGRPGVEHLDGVRLARVPAGAVHVARVGGLSGLSAPAAVQGRLLTFITQPLAG